MPTPEDQAQLELRSERGSLAEPTVKPDPEVQRKRMLIALGVLLVALVAVIFKEWDFWFPSTEEVEQSAVVKRRPAAASAATPAAGPASKNIRQPSKTSQQATAGPPFTATTERAALPPLQLEVVAGNRHTQVTPGSSAIRLDMDSGTASSPEQSPPVKEGVVNAADRVQMSPQTQQNLTVSVPPDYPLLARQMKVQGAVVLQALISREGSIQELQIVSGPTILAAAAREAVKQWRFKPYYQEGQAVETQARITVNFTISTN